MTPLSPLIDQINACGARDTVKMLALYQQYLQQLLGGFQPIWIAAYKRPFGRRLWHVKLMDDWKVVDAIFPIGDDRQYAIELKRYFKEALEKGGIDPQMTFSIEQAGKTRVARTGDAISAEQWSQHWMCERLLNEGVIDRMVGTYTLSDYAESYITIDRAVGEQPFSEEDAQRFYQALNLFPRLHYLLFLERGLIGPATEPLSPRQQDIVHLLLEPLSEQAIAEQLQLSKGTVHNYIIDIYKIFNVSSRYELIQLWL